MKANTPELMKFKRLQRQLKDTRRGVIGLLESMWIGTAKNCPEGDIGRFTNEEIAIMVDWEGDADMLVSVLVECGWLDVSEDHRLVVHDWSDHCPSYVKGGLAKKKKEAIGTSYSYKPEGSQLPPIGVPIATTSEVLSTKPSLTKPNQAKPRESGKTESATTSLAHTSEFASKRSESFQAAWRLWKNHQREKLNVLTPTSEEMALMELERCFPGNEPEQIKAIEFSIFRGAKNLITNGDHRKQTLSTDATKSSGQQFWERALAND